MTSRQVFALDIDRARSAHAPRQRQPVVVDVGDDDVAGADVPGDRRRHDADRSGAGDQHVFADQVERQRRMRRVAERVENRRQVIGDVVGDLERVERGDHQVFGERALAVDADADGVAAQMAAPGAAVAAEAAGDVAFARHAIADREAAHFLAHVDDFAHILVADVHRHRNRLARPFVPVPDVHVGAADRRLADPYHHVVVADLGLLHLGQLEARRGLELWRVPSSSVPFDCTRRAPCRPLRRPPPPGRSARQCAPRSFGCECAPCPSARPDRKSRSRRRPSASSASAIRVASVASPSITGMIGCAPGTRSKPSAVIAARKRSPLCRTRRRSSAPFAAQQQFEHAQRCRGDRRRERVRKQIRPRALPQQLDDLACARDVKPPDAPPSALPSVPVMMSTRPSTPQNSGVPRPPSPTKPTACESSTITSAPIPVGQIADRLQVRDDAVHREHAVGRDQLEAGAGGIGLVQLGLEVGHVVVAVAKALRLAQADAVDDAGMIQLVADDRVLFAQQRFEQRRRWHRSSSNTGCCLRCRGTRKASARAPCAPLCVPQMKRTDAMPKPQCSSPSRAAAMSRGIVGETQIVVRAEVEHFGARAQADVRRLRAFDHPLRLVEAIGADGIDGTAQMRQVIVMHDGVGWRCRFSVREHPAGQQLLQSRTREVRHSQGERILPKAGVRSTFSDAAQARSSKPGYDASCAVRGRKSVALAASRRWTAFSQA